MGHSVPRSQSSWSQQTWDTVFLALHVCTLQYTLFTGCCVTVLLGYHVLWSQLASVTDSLDLAQLGQHVPCYIMLRQQCSWSSYALIPECWSQSPYDMVCLVMAPVCFGHIIAYLGHSMLASCACIYVDGLQQSWAIMVIMGLCLHIHESKSVQKSA